MGLGGGGEKEQKQQAKRRATMGKQGERRPLRPGSVRGASHARFLRDLTDWEMERDVLKHSETAAVSFQSCSHVRG